MNVSITPPLLHPTSSVSIPATIKLMCITDRQPSTVKYSCYGTIQTRQTNDINSQDRPFCTTDDQRNSAVSLLLPWPPAQRRQQAQHGRASWVVFSARTLPARTWAMLCVCVCPQHPCYLPCCVYSIARLSLSSSNHQKTIGTKVEYFIYEQKVGK